MATSDSLKLPGYGLPVDYLPDEDSRFPITAGNEKRWGEIDPDWRANTLTVKELCMLRFVEEITNKPEWWIKVYDPVIANKWKAEALTLDWKGYHKWGSFTEAMAYACIIELRHKADLFVMTGLVPIYDFSGAVIKSDAIISQSLWDQLKKGAKVLEDVPDEYKDWHPGSNDKVLNLVHPSLWPLIYGQSRILTDKRIGLADALDHCGSGTILPQQDEIHGDYAHYVSNKFQWLPCDVKVEGGKATIESYINNLHPVEHAALYPVIEKFIEKSLPSWDILYRWPKEFDMQRITTLNAEPKCKTPQSCRKAPFFDCCEKTRPTRDDEPLRRVGREEMNWTDSETDESDTEEHGRALSTTAAEKSVLGDVKARSDEHDSSEYETESEPGPDCERYHSSDYDSDDDFNSKNQSREDNHVSVNETKRRDFRWFLKTHPIRVPEPALRSHVKLQPQHVKSSDFFASVPPNSSRSSGSASRRLQVIVKLANIHLTPDKPSYDGGSWHVEGLLNEHICATALFYYDNDNITESRLDFRTKSNREGFTEDSDNYLEYYQGDHRSIRRVFAIDTRGSSLQQVGGVLTRPGRALFFPNIYQHRVSPFQLTDPTRPGHRKILALFLVDPAVPVISTANVPPQQKSWWQDQVDVLSARLPPELTQMTLDNVDFPIAIEKAEELRKELMHERSSNSSKVNELMKLEWDFCEH